MSKLNSSTIHVTSSSIKDIALKANVSRMTAYKVLNNKGNVKKKNIEAVYKACEELNYSVNKAARNLSINKTFKICISYFINSSTRYHENILKGIMRAFQEFKDYRLEIIIQPIDSSFESQSESISKKYQEGIENFIVIPLATKEVENCINNLSKKGAKFVILNRDCNFFNKLSYIGCNYKKMGKLIGEILNLINLENKIILPVRNEFLNDRYTLEKIEGLKYELLKKHKTNICEIIPIKNNDSIKDLFSKILDSKQTNFIIDLSGNTVTFAEFIKEYNLENHIKIIAFDLYNEYLPYLKNNIISFIVDQNLEEQGYFSLKFFFEYLSFGNKIPNLIESKVSVIFNHNIPL